jgi:DNA-binding NarL/FixJ family response regulator
VVSPDELLRRRAASALMRDGQTVRIETASSDALDSEPGRRADAVVLAGCARADHRAAAIRAAKSRLPGVLVVVVANADTHGVHKALEAGADGFVLDSDLDNTLAPTVRAVCAGQLALPPMARARAAKPPLSHREQQTLDLLGLGLTNAQIGQRLFIAESTVKCHLTSIFSKLGVRSRNEAIVMTRATSAY